MLIRRIGLLAASGKARVRFMGMVHSDGGGEEADFVAAIDAENMEKARSIRAGLLDGNDLAERLSIRFVEAEPDDFSFALIP